MLSEQSVNSHVREVEMSSQCITWPAPAEEVASPDYTVDVDGCPVFVYQARVRAEILQNDGLWTHERNPVGSRAPFAMFDMRGPVTVTVRPARPFRTATVLPTRAGITAEVADGCVRFTLAQPQHLTLLLDGTDETPLHLFISAPETDVPSSDDPNVLYFGPGTHEIETIAITSGQTVYLAGGAVVKAVLRAGEVGTFSDKWKVTFYNGIIFEVNEASNVRICGRGILDGSQVPHPGRNMLQIKSSQHVSVSGITLRDAPNWNVMLNQSADVTVENVRIVSGRLNSDGINSVNSQRVNIRNCFVRNHDDSIAMKATVPGIPTEDVLVEDCTIWDDWGYALGVTYETRSPIHRITFRRCNVLFARHWCMGVYLSDCSTVSDITFTDIEIADQSFAGQRGAAYAALSGEPMMLRMAIVEDCWGTDPERGHIRDITFENITQYGDHLLACEITGHDAEHGIDNVTLRNIHLAGQPPVSDIAALPLQLVEHVRGLHIEA